MPATIGIDIGQAHDPTAIAVCQPEWREVEDSVYGDQDCHWLCRHLERLPLGTPYPQVGERLAEICYLTTYKAGHLEVFIDATGVGKPVVDILRDAMRGVDTTLRPVYFTHGWKRTEDHHTVNLGKAYLVSRLRALLETRRLHLPKSNESRALADELMNYEIRIDDDANDRYGAFKVGAHDDLVTALGLATNIDPVGVEMVM